MFLVALCLSIFLEAIQRLFEPKPVSNPMLILIVGSLGLASNIVGLFLFHDHGHSHGGGHSHSHGGTDDLAVAEEGHSHSALGGHTAAMADEGGNVADVLPQTTIAGWPESKSVTRSRREGSGSHEQSKKSSQGFSKSDEEDSTVANSTLSPISTRRSGPGSGRRRRQGSGGSRHRFPSVEDLPIHPSSFRNEFIAASRENRLDDIESRDGSASDEEEATKGGRKYGPTENSPLVSRSKSNGSAKDAQNGHSHNYNATDSPSSHPDHNQPKDASGDGHSHSDLNMRGVFLHVMGDALGNIGVIASALFIWLTHYSWRFYADPVISLLITCIIFASAWPLCKAASRILLQAVPAHINVDDIKEDIEDIPGVISCHDIHVWQLSGDQMIASLHIKVDFDFKGEGSARYMDLAKAVQRCLHAYGVHSTTLQPEFCLDPEHRHGSGTSSDGEGSDNGKPKVPSKVGSKAASTRSEAACLLDCEDGCGAKSTAVDPDVHHEEEHSH